MGGSLSPEAQQVYEDSIWQYVDLSAFALLFYDTILTAPEELQLIWRCKIRFGAILYVIARYATLCVQFLSILIDFSALGEDCDRPMIASDFINVFAIMATRGLLVARVYAIYRDRRWLGYLPVIVYLAYASEALVTAGVARCTTPLHIAKRLHITGDALTVILEATVCFLTVFHTFSTYRLLLRSKERKSLSSIILEQGVIRFIIILLFKVEIIIGEKVWPGYLGDVEAGLELSVSTILICRFHLGLLRSNMKTINGRDSEIGSVTTFQAAVRRIGDTIGVEFGDHKLTSTDVLSDSTLTRNDSYDF